MKSTHIENILIRCGNIPSDGYFFIPSWDNDTYYSDSKVLDREVLLI